MKKTILKGLVLVLATAMTVACSDGIGLGFGQGTGKISLSTEVDASVASGRSSRAEYTDITPADLSVRLTSSDGSFTETWNSVAEFPLDRTFKAGKYTMEVFYGDEDTEGFESPAFYGTQNLVVEENLTTPVHVVAGVVNSMVSVVYTDNFKDYMTSYSAEVHSAGGQYIEFATDETRPAYVKPGRVTLSVDFVKPNGNGGKLEVASFDAVAARHYTVTVDLGNGGAGSATIVIDIDENLADGALQPIDISDEVLNAPAPTVTAKGFNPDETFLFVPGQVLSSEFVCDIIARGGLSAVTLTTQSSSLLARNWPAEIDLIAATSTEQTTLTDLGFACRGLFKNPDKLAVADFTNVLANISYLGSGDNVTTFTVVVKDKLGKLSDPFTFKVQAEPLRMNVTNTQMYVGADLLTFDLEFNGGDPATYCKFEYFNSRGTWSVFTPSLTNTGNNTYAATATITGVDNTAALKMRYSAEGLGSVEMDITRDPMVVPSTETDNVFATRAYIPVTIGEQDSNISLLTEMMNDASIYISTDGTGYSAMSTAIDVENKMLGITGLTPATTYYIKVKNGDLPLDLAPVKTITTETAAQIPNGNLDAEVTEEGSGRNWELIMFQGWGTNNIMTTSPHTSVASDYAYDTISGTIATTDSHSGNAALIRTCGWGAGNTALSGVNGVCKYIDPGMLHLGSNREVRPSGYTDRSGPLNTDDLNCGIEFASRPSSLSFWYKYTAKNSSDHGEALVQVLDASGNVLASAITNLAAQSVYTQVTLNLSYTSKVKAAKVYVRFLSTNISDALTKSSSWLSGPGFANTSRGTYMGSQLYIDDVTFNY